MCPTSILYFLLPIPYTFIFPPYFFSKLHILNHFRVDYFIHFMGKK